MVSLCKQKKSWIGLIITLLLCLREAFRPLVLAGLSFHGDADIESAVLGAVAPVEIGKAGAPPSAHRRAQCNLAQNIEPLASTALAAEL